jgi:hypothetical protein
MKLRPIFILSLFLAAILIVSSDATSRNVVNKMTKVGMGPVQPVATGNGPRKERIVTGRETGGSEFGAAPFSFGRRHKVTDSGVDQRFA